MRTAFLIILVAVISVGVSSAVFSLTGLHFLATESQGPYTYDLVFGEGLEAKNLGVVVTMNLSFVKTWFVGEGKNVNLEVSAERVSDKVQSFSWCIFWIELNARGGADGNWKTVGIGSHFLDASETDNAYLFKRQDVSVSVVNLNYLESAGNAWLRVGIMMDVYYNSMEYSFTFYTPMAEIGPVNVLSPIYSPTSLAAQSAVAVVFCATLARQLRIKTMSGLKKGLLENESEVHRS